MTTGTTNRLLTADELWRMPHDHMRHELVKGEMRTMPPAGFEHGAIIIKLSRLLANHVEANHLGLVTGAETGFIVGRNPDTVRGADVAFVGKARLPTPLPKAFFPGAPDLAVEVLSPTDTVEDVEEKVTGYLDGGSKIVWVISPKARTVTVCRPSANPVVLREAESLSGDDVVPGFTCKIIELFV
ncbi:MAG TPA: Uma2 family endonuclease [Tepidisphaeraceae bacterium]|jgi:Uma2 family endonuclease